MRILKLTSRIILLLLFIVLVADCNKNQEADPCLKTKWPQPKVYEIKLAIHFLPSNTALPGGTPGSQYPSEYENLVVNGSVVKLDCSQMKSGYADLGNNYVNRSHVEPALIDIPESYWIGHVVYIYELNNDLDKLRFNLFLTITMNDQKSYICFLTQEVNFQDIIQVPMQNYYYILLNINSFNWVKV